jgi:hypothetical protein
VIIVCSALFNFLQLFTLRSVFIVSLILRINVCYLHKEH